MQRRENEILESKVQIEITKFKTKMIIRKPSQDELRSTVRAFIKKAGYVIKTCYNGKNNICVMDKYYTNCQFLSKRSMQWPLKEVVYVDLNGRFHIRQTAKLSYVMPESFYK